MDIYKGRRILGVITAPARVPAPRREFHEIPYKEQLGNMRRERADREAFDAKAVEAFLAAGGNICICKQTTKCVRKEQRFGRVTIPAIYVPVIPVKGGAISYCAPRSRG